MMSTLKYTSDPNNLLTQLKPNKFDQRFGRHSKLIQTKQDNPKKTAKEIPLAALKFLDVLGTAGNSSVSSPRSKDPAAFSPPSKDKDAILTL